MVAEDMMACLFELQTKMTEYVKGGFVAHAVLQVRLGAYVH